MSRGADRKLKEGGCAPRATLGVPGLGPPAGTGSVSRWAGMVISWWLNQHLLKAFALDCASPQVLRSIRTEMLPETTHQDGDSALSAEGAMRFPPVVASLVSVGVGGAGGAGCV